jgi:hypothetical protein
MPTDTTPDPLDMERRSESQAIPQTVPGGRPAQAEKPDISKRPGLPERPQIMAADIEDEDEDPVVDSGPGITSDNTGDRR